MKNPEDEIEWRQSFDPYQKYKLLEKFYQRSIFPFLDWLHSSLRLTWQGLMEQLSYECQFNGRKYMTVTKPSELHDEFIQFGQANSADLLEVQILINLAIKPQFNHTNGTGALVAFRYLDGYYHLSNDRVETKIAHRADEQLSLKEAHQLIQDIQAHLLFVLANEHPSVTDPHSSYKPDND